MTLTSFSVHSPYVILYLIRYEIMGELPISELTHLSVIESEVTLWTRMEGGLGGTETRSSINGTNPTMELI